MTEEKRQDQHQEPAAEDEAKKNADTEAEKDATDERVASEEESGGALPSNRSNED